MRENLDEKVKVKSLAKAIRVLNCFLEKQPLGVTEISEKLDLYKSNVHDILSTLAAAEYVVKDTETGKYHLGLGALRLGRASNSINSFQSIASAHIQEIASLTGEICYLTVPEDFKVYYLDVALPKENYSLMSNLLRNSTDEMNTTSCGKVMLAYMPEARVEEYLKHPLLQLTEHTVTDPEDLRRELTEIRRQGYAVANMENAIGLNAVAVPLLSGAGVLAGALSVCGPTFRLTEERERECVEILRTHAEAICRFL